MPFESSGAGIRKCEFVFYNPETGSQWKDLWLGLKRACRKAGLDDVTWHTFRHTFASRLNSNGADLVTVKDLLGHSDVKTTLRYSHTNRDASEVRLPDLVSLFGVTPRQEGRIGLVTVFATPWEIR